MNVAIEKTRQYETPTGIDHFLFGLTKLFDFGLAADRDDFVALNRHRFRPRLLCVDGVDLRVMNDRVRALRVGLSRYGADACQQKNDERERSKAKRPCG